MQGRRHRHLPDRFGDQQISEAGLRSLRSDLQCADTRALASRFGRAPASNSNLASCETDVINGRETCVRVGACTRSQRGRRDSLCPTAAASGGADRIEIVAASMRTRQRPIDPGCPCFAWRSRRPRRSWEHSPNSSGSEGGSSRPLAVKSAEFVLAARRRFGKQAGVSLSVARRRSGTVEVRRVRSSGCRPQHGYANPQSGSLACVRKRVRGAWRLALKPIREAAESSVISIQERVKRKDRRIDSKMRRSWTASLAVCEASRIM